jgi:hypothetical protein
MGPGVAAGTIGTLVNNAGGVISGGQQGVQVSSGTIGTLINAGLISARNPQTARAIDNRGAIGSLVNSGTLTAGNPQYYYSNTYLWGVRNGPNATITSLNNSGLISGGGLVFGAAVGMSGPGMIGTLTNSGTIASSQIGIQVAPTGGPSTGGTIGAITNSGVISGGVRAIDYAAGSIGPITNTGSIAGNIANATANDLNIGGGSGAIYGTLTGYSGGLQGVITNTNSNIYLTGNQLLDDAVNVGAFTMFSSGNLQINRTVAVTGNFTQTGGVLRFGVTSSSSYGNLAISGGSANLNAGSVMLIPLTTNVLVSGQSYTIMSASGTINAAGVTSTVAGFYSGLIAGAHTVVVKIASAAPTPTPTPASAPTLPPASNYTTVGAQTGGGAAGAGKAVTAIITGGTSTAQTAAFNQLVTPLLASLTPSQVGTALTQLAPNPITTSFAQTIPDVTGALSQLSPSPLSLGFAESVPGVLVSGAVNPRQLDFSLAVAGGEQFASLDGDDDYAGLGHPGPRPGPVGQAAGRRRQPAQRRQRGSLQRRLLWGGVRGGPFTHRQGPGGRGHQLGRRLGHRDRQLRRQRHPHQRLPADRLRRRRPVRLRRSAELQRPVWLRLQHLRPDPPDRRPGGSRPVQLRRPADLGLGDGGL